MHGDINCKTTSVIYCIFCAKCDTNIYVGQTGTHFTIEVFVNSDKKTEHPVANHFCNNNHTVEKYKVIDIERVNGDVILLEVKQSF
jgi:hypothetical protein